MKKKVAEVSIILIVSMACALLFPNFIKYNQTIKWPGMHDFTIWTIVIFAFILMLFYTTRSTEKTVRLPDGFHELFNSNNQITKKGMFEAGKQVSGTKHVYKNDGTLSHIETCVNGEYDKEV